MNHHPAWSHPFWEHLHQHTVVSITEIVDGMPLPEPLPPHVGHIRATPYWDLYTLSEWTEWYRSCGLSAPTDYQPLLNDILKTVDTQKLDIHSQRMMKALWLSLCASYKWLWIAPEWTRTSPDFQNLLMRLIEQSKQLPLRWIIANHDHAPCIPYSHIAHASIQTR